MPPVVVGQAVIENALSAVLPHVRHAPAAGVHGERAEAGEVRELGVGLGELVGLLLRGRPAAIGGDRAAMLLTPCDQLLAVPVFTGIV